MRAFQKTVLFAFVSFLSVTASAYRYMGAGSPGGGMTTAPPSSSAEDSRAAACAPATGLRDLEWNNVRARIETGGNMWQDRANSRAAYEVPKDGGVSSLYAGALWLGGKSQDATLKLAAVTFRADGNDFWPGPLTNDGTAEVTPATCEFYDDFAVTLRLDAQQHRLYHELNDSGASDEYIASIFPTGYSMPSYFNTYPAHGNTSQGQDYYLAPFYDYNENLVYDPENGDYPKYDLLAEIDCAQKRREDEVPLFGDQTLYWIFNDKGNIHSESQGQPIGMEIRAQAFAFTTNDEVNNMTFLNYVVINQGTQTLTETYFGSFVDCDLGNSTDDYVGCDVQRGLGYDYNGDAFDEPISQSLGYGENPPAVGVDFFEGPFQDADTMANPLTSDIALAEQLRGIPYEGLGIGYGDTIIDNERFGMRRFVYYNIGTNPIFGDPSAAQHYYNYMRGIWKNGQTMIYGGNGVSGTGTIAGLEAQYMFPGDTDPYDWGTHGIVTPDWTEQTAGNVKGDRRFIQSAGPFTLAPGDYNNITLGVVWARAFSGDAFQSVKLLRRADDKAQSLFDNCFRIVDGPDAPEVAVQELDREIILMLSNENSLSNNYQETYLEFDPSIPHFPNDSTELTQEERSYTFEGYLVYQLANGEVSNGDLADLDKARLIAQTDIRNGVENLVNYNRDQTTDLIIPELMVEAANDGIQRSFRITRDAFATGATALINHKTYYFMVIAYGFNEYEPYDIATSTGQDEVFKASRKSSLGEVRVVKAIPHNVAPENGGTTAHSVYGSGISLIRLEGKGNGLNDMTISSQSENELLVSPYSIPNLQYLEGAGPVEIKVVDPLRVPAAEFELSLEDTVSDPDDADDIDLMFWSLLNVTDGSRYNTYSSFRTLSEDVLLNYGISVNWGQYEYLNEDQENLRHFTDFISATFEFADPNAPWLTGVPDADGLTEFNWIRAGTLKSDPAGNIPESESIYDDYISGVPDIEFMDPTEIYEKVLNGTWAPYSLVSSSHKLTDGGWLNSVAPTTDDLNGQIPDVFPSNPAQIEAVNNILHLNNVDVVLTSDKSKWTRCPVLEMQPDATLAQDAIGFDPASTAETKMKFRMHYSVDKNGRIAGESGYNAAEGELNGAIGMGWFPGYTIDVGTGERLNMAFGEDSWLAGSNGRDMIWNPSFEFTNASGEALFGGQHWVYVFRNLRNADHTSGLADYSYMPRYDEGHYADSVFSTGNAAGIKKLMRACTWVGSAVTFAPMLSPEDGLIPNDVRVRLRVAQPYKKYSWNDKALDDVSEAQNEWRPLYKFSTAGIAATTNDATVLESALDMINIVPNPYYAFSSYETSKLDNRVKIVNLPFVCTVTIYNLNGTLVRQFKKSDPTTSLDWDLKNHKNIPIASGTYIIHVDVPNVGEKVLKWFGVMRPVDLDNF